MIQRRNYFIKKGFQFNFAAKFMILILLEAALIVGLFIYVSGNTLTTGYSDSILTIDTTSNFFFFPMAMIILITVVGIAMAGMIVFILLSHRIAGPLYRFEKDLEDMGYGDLSKRIGLRKTDQLTGIKESLNSLIATFDERVIKIKGLLAELKALADTKDPGNLPGIQSAANKLKEELDRFKVTSGPNE
jgi:methyl-accepting chemotaxis protein